MQGGCSLFSSGQILFVAESQMFGGCHQHSPKLFNFLLVPTCRNLKNCILIRLLNLFISQTRTHTYTRENEIKKKKKEKKKTYANHNGNSTYLKFGSKPILVQISFDMDKWQKINLYLTPLHNPFEEWFMLLITLKKIKEKKTLIWLRENI